MNGVGFATVGRLLGHRKRATTAIYARLDDAALRDAAAQTASIIASAMGYTAEPLPDETDGTEPGIPRGWIRIWSCRRPGRRRGCPARSAIVADGKRRPGARAAMAEFTERCCILGGTCKEGMTGALST